MGGRRCEAIRVWRQPDFPRRALHADCKGDVFRFQSKPFRFQLQRRHRSRPPGVCSVACGRREANPARRPSAASRPERIDVRLARVRNGAVGVVGARRWRGHPEAGARASDGTDAALDGPGHRSRRSSRASQRLARWMAAKATYRREVVSGSRRRSRRRHSRYPVRYG